MKCRSDIRILPARSHSVGVSPTIGKEESMCSKGQPSRWCESPASNGRINCQEVPRPTISMDTQLGA